MKSYSTFQLVLQVFFSTFCASWRPDLMARPGSNDMERCHQWIDAVYEKRNFFSDTRANLESASSASKDSIAESPALKVGNENVAVLNMSDVVAGASVIVSAGRKTSSTGNVESEEDKIKRTTKAKEEWKLELGERQKEGGSIAIKASTLLNQSASEKPASPQLVQLQGALLDKWDPFGILNEQQSIDQSRSKSSNEGGWAVFDISMAEPQKESPSTLKTSSLLATHTLETVSEVKETQKEEIKNTSKGDLPMENDKANVADLDLKAVSLSDSTFSQTAGLLPAEHEALNRSITENPVRDTGKVDTSNSDVRKDHRKEVPLVSVRQCISNMCLAFLIYCFFLCRISFSQNLNKSELRESYLQVSSWDL